jgi:hypothetical protein
MQPKEEERKLKDMRRKTIHDAEEFVLRHMRMDEFETKEADVVVFDRLAHRGRSSKACPEERASQSP